ncbi:MAG: HupE/UreJ family protein, partial [Polaribacter sp.]|nr:HupE/UreJ family protein [Polaribacter sp.]
HSISLTLAAFEIINIKVEIIEFLIPGTIFITGVTNIFNAKKTSKTKNSINLIFALFFGLIHGLGFSNYFRAMIGKEDDKLIPLVEFALGIEAAQVIIVLLIVSLGYILQNVAKVAKRDWILVTSSIVVGFSIQMMLDRVFW